MKTLVLVFHPDLTASRGNRRLAEEIKQQDNVTVHYVYQAYRDEKIDVAAGYFSVDMLLLERY